MSTFDETLERLNKALDSRNAEFWEWLRSELNHGALRDIDIIILAQAVEESNTRHETITWNAAMEDAASVADQHRPQGLHVKHKHEGSSCAATIAEEIRERKL